jgi:hypothetical protein
MKTIKLCTFILIGISTILSCERPAKQSSIAIDSLAFSQAAANGRLVNEGFERCRLFVDGWLQHADPETGLIPRNLQDSKDIWNAQDAAADNYPFMVLTAALTDQELFEGRMRDMLRTETELTSRIDALPDTYSFKKQAFEEQQPNVSDIMFGASEYIKDGLLPLTEWLGPSPWSERMISILDDMWEHAPVETEYGNIVSTNVEVNGEMLQTLSRIYWMTGERKYLDWALRLGDYYLLGNQHPTRSSESLRLRDHGCEIVSGICELYATVSFVLPEKKQEYEEHVHIMLDKILEVGRNEHGLFYDVVNPQNGEILNERIADNFGYTLNGFYTVYEIDSIEAYRDATLKALGTLNENYRNFEWEGSSSDGYADAIEGALNLYAREPIPSTAEWLDSEIKVMWAKQQEDGVIEGWHGDGNFARTTIMYCLWKTQGMTPSPWRSDVQVGVVRENQDLMISMSVDEDWEGVFKFDSPRHKTIMHLPIDWPRINQFPEWFVVEEDQQYELIDVNQGKKDIYTGAQLHEGVTALAKKGENLFMLKKITNGEVKYQ